MVDVDDVVESPATEDGGVNHVEAIGHRHHQDLVLCSFRNSSQKLCHFFDPILAARGISLSEESIHLVDHQDRWRALYGAVKDLGHLATGLMDVGARDRGRL